MHISCENFKLWKINVECTQREENKNLKIEKYGEEQRKIYKNRHHTPPYTFREIGSELSCKCEIK